MKNMAQQILIFLIFALWHGQSLGSEQKEYFSSILNGICGDEKYTKCINISKVNCEKSLMKAINSCPMKKIDNSDIEVGDAPCITNRFFEIANIPDNTISSCEYIMEKKSKIKKEELKKLYPNNQINRDHPELRPKNQASAHGVTLLNR